jgi:glycine/serine hydroxymethyltransferase
VEKVLEAAAITVNKNAVPGDLKPFIPGGIRIGTLSLSLSLCLTPHAQAPRP